MATLHKYSRGYSVKCDCSHWCVPLGLGKTFDDWQCRGCGNRFRVKHGRKEEQMPDKKPQISEYKGNKLLCLNPNDKFTFSFGVQKAKMILEHIDSIRIFAESNGEICGSAEGEEDNYLSGKSSDEALSRRG